MFWGRSKMKIFTLIYCTVFASYALHAKGVSSFDPAYSLAAYFGQPGICSLEVIERDTLSIINGRKFLVIEYLTISDDGLINYYRFKETTPGGSDHVLSVNLFEKQFCFAVKIPQNYVVGLIRIIGMHSREGLKAAVPVGTGTEYYVSSPGLPGVGLLPGDLAHDLDGIHSLLSAMSRSAPSDEVRDICASTWGTQ
jgi:hypothetical protein